MRSLSQYFQETGTDDAFQKMRYWELGQRLEDVLIRRVDLRIHREILCALQQLLIRSGNYAQRTVTHRVEERIRQEMLANMSYGQCTQKERAVKSLTYSHAQGKSWRSILLDTVQFGFNLGEESLNRDMFTTFQDLLQSDDPAIRYFAETCTILPRQPRDLVPDVRWVIQDRSGEVLTPMGTVLGYIQRGPDGIWIASSPTNSPSVRTQTQTDARSYLGNLMSSLATILIDGEAKQFRLVGNGIDVITPGGDNRWTNGWDPTMLATYNLEFWILNTGWKWDNQ